jgi:hypothetical protein
MLPKKVRLTVSETEKTLVQKARELAKLEKKRAEAVALVDQFDAAIVTVKAEIAALVQPKS